MSGKEPAGQRGGEGKRGEGAPTELPGEEKTQKQLILLAELFL